MMKNQQTTVDALLLITPGCPHCPVVLQGLSELVKDGTIGALEVVNVARHPERAAELGVRTAPWVRLGPFELEGQRSAQELRTWALRAASPEGFSAYLEELLKGGQLGKAEALLEAEPARLEALLPLLEHPDTPMQLRLGAGALIEAAAGSEALRGLVPALGRLTEHADHRVRGDACYYLGLAHSAQARPYLEARLGDEHADVRESAAEALEDLDA